MKKKLLMLVVAVISATATFAQNNSIATLNHGGNISVFYGLEALKQAFASAEAGDAITLSSGKFNAVDITKPVILRGAGMSTLSDSISSHEPTIIQGNFNINISDTISGRLMIESIYSNSTITNSGALKSAQFMKCRFNTFNQSSSGKMTATSFIHCRISNQFKATKADIVSDATFINSIIRQPYCSSSFNIEFDNCFIRMGGTIEICDKAYYKNTIIHSIASGAIPSSCRAVNSVCIGTSIFGNMSSINSTNKYVADKTTLFKSYNVVSNNSIADVTTFELTDTAAATYLGTDGTQVGIYGGNLPYDENPIVPQITKCNVASKSTADGKLSVDIEVKAAE